MVLCALTLAEWNALYLAPTLQIVPLDASGMYLFKYHKSKLYEHCITNTCGVNYQGKVYIPTHGQITFTQRATK